MKRLMCLAFVAFMGCEDECEDNTWRCAGDTLQQCFVGEWEDHTACDEVWDAEGNTWICCVDECLPAAECTE